MTISKRDAKLLLILFGIVILLVGYLAVYNPYNNKADEVKAEISELETSAEELRGYYNNLDAYYAGIDSASEIIEEEMGRYPTSVRHEDMIMYAISMEKDIDIDITNISFSGPNVVAAFQGASEDENGETVVKDMTAQQNAMTVSCDMSYKGLKDMIKYITKTEQRTTLDSVSVSFDAETAQINGSATFNKYFISSPDDEYVETQVPKIPLGKDDLFGTYNVSVAAQEESPDENQD